MSPLPLKEIDGHRYLVLSLYRTLIRNSIHSKLKQKDKFQLTLKLRKRFRTDKELTNGLQIQNKLVEANELNNLLFKSYTQSEDSNELLKRINPNFYVKNITNEKKPSFKSKSIPIPIYLRTLPLRPYKSTLDDNYVKDILPSLIKYKQQSLYLEKLEGKLLNRVDSGAKLKRINGTSSWIYVINTPWNRDLRTESMRWISDVRVKYDKLINDLNQLDSQKAQMCKSAKLQDNPEEDYLWSIKESEKVLKAEINELNKVIKLFNIKQGAILKSLKPVFDSNHLKFQSNLKRLLKVKERLQIGPYTDIINNGDLKILLNQHYFRSSKLDQIETSNNLSSTLSK